MSPPPPFHGWWVVAGTFAVLCTGFGIAYCFPAYFLTLQQEFGARRGDTSLVFSIAGALYFSLGILSGSIADRFGPRAVVAGGMALVGLGTLLASQATSLWQIYLGYGVGVGVGIGFAYVPAVAAVQRWFLRQRGLATGIAVAGIGVGTAAGPPLAKLMIDAWGWRAADIGLGVAALVVAAFAFFTLLRSPEAYGQRPDGDAVAGGGAPPPVTGESLAEAMRSRPFWFLFTACLLTSFGLFIPFVHLGPYAAS